MNANLCQTFGFSVALVDSSIVALKTPHFQLSCLNYSYKLTRMLSVCVYLDVNQGGINPNRCTHRLIILHAQTYY